MSIYRVKRIPNLPKHFSDDLASTLFEEPEEMKYWQGFYSLHSWFEKLYRDTSGRLDSFNCVWLELTKENLEDLYCVIYNGGFDEDPVYNYSPERKFADMKFILHAKRYINKNYAIYYKAWW